MNLECSGGLALASPPFERCPEGNELNALPHEQEASLAKFLKVSASSWRLPEDATKANVERFQPGLKPMHSTIDAKRLDNKVTMLLVPSVPWGV